MGRESAADVRFDFSGSLQLARRLWQLADEADQLAGNRERWAGEALSTWTGRFADDFAERVNGELSDVRAFANDMRGAADNWAFCWSEAMNEQNDIYWAREYHRRETSRNFFEKLGDKVFGGEIEAPPSPAPLSPPVSPNFIETGSFTRY